jgi:hypothetical protein
VPTSYLDVASILFGNRSFTINEFEARTGALRGARLLSEMKTRGLVERTGRGTYRVLPLDKRLDMRGAEWGRVNRALLDSNLPMAWTGADAVRIWTGGRYTVSPSAFLHEFHIEIPSAYARRWRAYLRAHRVSTDSRRRIGSKVVLHARPSIRPEVHRGEPVSSRSATLAMIREHRGLYADADRFVES